MTYFSFLLRFVILPIIILLLITLWDNKHIHGFRNGRAVWMAIGIHILLAVIYTTPWDNYLVATGVWNYNPRLVTGIVFGYVPIEEYIFFVVETILAGLWWWFLVLNELINYLSVTGLAAGVFNNNYALKKAQIAIYSSSRCFFRAVKS